MQDDRCSRPGPFRYLLTGCAHGRAPASEMREDADLTHAGNDRNIGRRFYDGAGTLTTRHAGGSPNGRGPCFPHRRRGRDKKRERLGSAPPREVDNFQPCFPG